MIISCLYEERVPRNSMTLLQDMISAEGAINDLYPPDAQHPQSPFS